MAYRQTRPLNMKGPLKRNTTINIGSKKNLGEKIDADVDGNNPTMFYNSNMAPLKQIPGEEEVTSPEAPTGEAPMGEAPMGEAPMGDDEKNIDLLPSEHPDTSVYSGEDVGERIADYEDRISFIKEDIWNQDDVPTKQQEEDVQILKSKLAELREEQ